MNYILLVITSISVIWAVFCTYVIYNLNKLIYKLNMKLEWSYERNDKLNDQIRELLYPDEKPNNDIDWFNKE